LARGLEEPEFRHAIVAQQPTGFTWQASARLVRDALDRFVPRPSPTRATDPRIAVVTPLPPQPSGIAYYSARLLPELAQHGSVTAFTSVNDEEGNVEFSQLPGCSVRGLHELEGMHYGGQPFDRVIYMMGNSRFHVHALRMLRLLPGAVIFHDARYVGLYNELYRIHPGDLRAEYVGQLLNRMYPDRYRRAVVESHTIDPDTAVRFGILMAAEIMQHATDRFCHSDHAARLLSLDAGFPVDHLFDLPVPVLGEGLPSREASVVGVFGIVDPAKNPEMVLEACSLAQGPNTTIRFVGECEPALRDHLQTRAAELEVEVQFTGLIDPLEFQRQQRSVTLAIQLRRFSNGESSGALAELIGAGTPTITTALGAATELPDDVVVTVNPDPSARDLAASVSELISNRDLALRMAEAMRRYSDVSAYHVAAERLVQALDRRAAGF
jgi:glycosyltransferase involved in cell wall biosynthesis